MTTADAYLIGVMTGQLVGAAAGVLLTHLWRDAKLATAKRPERAPVLVVDPSWSTPTE